MNLNLIEFQPLEISVKNSRIYRLLHYDPAQPPDYIEEEVNSIKSVYMDYIKPVCGIRIFDESEIRPDAESVKLAGIELNTKKIISLPLRKSEKIIVFIATLGGEFEKYAHECIEIGNSLRGYLIDLIASEMVEELGDLVETRLASIYNAEGLHLSNRYSPGYCGWDVRDQRKIFSFFPKEFGGISLNESFLMTPLKSISGIIGVGRDLRKEQYTCEECEAEFCIKRFRY